MRTKSPLFLIRCIQHVAYFATLTVVLLGAFPAQAAKPPSTLFQVLCIDGVTGDSLIAGYVGCSILTDYSQTLESPAPGDVVCEGRAKKNIDSASPAIWEKVASGEPFTNLFVAIVNPETGYERFRAVMPGVVVQAVATVASDTSTESIEEILLVPGVMTLQFTPLSPDGSPGATISTTVDCTST